MSEKDYDKAFRELGIQTEPLPENYTPDLFAKSLIERYDKRPPVRIIYSSSIEYRK